MDVRTCLCLLIFSFSSLSIAQDESTLKGWAPSSNDQALKVQFKVEKFALKNGMTVLLLEDHSIPRVSYHTWFRVGSRDEQPGYTGSAHMLEHMMFKGSTKFPRTSFEKILHENGMSNNAFTTYDYTGYYQNLPSTKLDLMMDIEVDRIANLSLNPEDLTSEREVVKEERRYRVDNNPMGLLRENLMMTLFRTSPYHWPVIGYMKDITNYTVEKLRDFHNKYYVANNGVLVLVGDFDTAKTKALIEKKYAVLPFKELPKPNYPKEKEQLQPRKGEVKKDVASSTFILAYPGPAAGSDDSYVLDLAANILGSGNSSRLFQRYVYKGQVATWAGAFNQTLKDSSTFEIFVALNPGQKAEPIVDTVITEVWKLKNKEVTPKELEKAKNQVMKEHVDGLMTIDGKARALATNEILFGDYQMMFKDLERYQAVTAKQILTTAQKYLKPQNQNLVVLRSNQGEKP